jgi:hypothetical protein
MDESWGAPSDWVHDFAEGLGFDLTLDDAQSFLPPVTSLEDWETLIKPRLTCRHLGEWLWQWLPPVTFDPVNIAGHECGPAGAFLGLEALAKHITPNVDRFSPSCCVLDRLQGTSLRRFWGQLRLLTGIELPELVNANAVLVQRSIVNSLWLALAVIVSSLLLLNPNVPFGLAMALLFAWLASIPKILATFAFACWWGPSYRTLPWNIVTFRDLANCVSTFQTQSIQGR